MDGRKIASKVLEVVQDIMHSPSGAAAPDGMAGFRGFGR
jgi:hypothetical protein